MADSETLNPVVGSILEDARDRGEETAGLSVSPRSLTSAIDTAAAAGQVPVIAEVKPTSPTTDGVREDDPVEIAQEMVAGGATALSVLTEPAHFGGSPDHLTAVREAVDVPVLRKDFIVSEDQLDTVEADVILLIARFVEDLPSMVAAARDRGFQVLVETHTRSEVEDAVEAGAAFIGINNRDLSELVVDLSTFERVAPAVPEDVTLIAESGIGSPEDVRRMRSAGADALLIGSAIMDGPVQENTATLVDGGEQ
jgi:indole-3-glycerol phosphate synthase